MEPLKRFEEGDERTMLSAEVANEFVDRINALCSMQVTPDLAAQFVYADANITLQLNGVPFLDVVENGVLSTYLVAKRTGPS